MFVFILLQRLLMFLSLAVLAVGVWLVADWWNVERIADAFGQAEPGDTRLWWGLGLLAFSLLGRLPILLLLGRSGEKIERPRGEGREIAAADGATLWVEGEAKGEGPIVVFTHGWGMNCRVWAEARRDLSPRFDTVFWDLPGCGKSGKPKAGWSIEGFAEDLATVVEGLPADRKVVLVGHSIGGMTTQTMCALRPDLLTGRVAGIVLENTTHTNPLKTMILSKVLVPLQPVIEVACKIETVIFPLTWLMMWQSYLSGSTHLAMRIAGFGTQPTREQLDRAALLVTKTSPAVQAHGNLAMIRWSVTERLASIDVPALVFVGGRDIVTKDHAGETIADALPQARLVRVEDAGHMGPVERHEVYHPQIAAFVEGLSTKAPAAPEPMPVSPKVNGSDQVMPPAWGAAWDLPPART